MNPPSTLRFLVCDHLPLHLQEVAKPFHEIAVAMIARGGDAAEVHAGVRKLLEAKDCAVRALIPAPPKAE